MDNFHVRNKSERQCEDRATDFCSLNATDKLLKNSHLRNFQVESHTCEGGISTNTGQKEISVDGLQPVSTGFSKK